MEGRASILADIGEGHVSPFDSLEISKIYHGEVEDGDFANKEGFGSVLSSE